MKVLQLENVSLSLRRLKELKTLLRAMTNEFNQKLLNAIDEYREPTVRDLYEEMQSSQSYTSQRLGFFRDNDIIYYKQFGKKHKYFINALRVKQLDDLMRIFGQYTIQEVYKYPQFYDIVSVVENKYTVQVLQFLIDAELPQTMTAVKDKFKWQQSSTSDRLGQLRAFNLVTAQRQSKNIYYSANLEALTSIAKSVNTFYKQKEVSIII